MNFPEFQNYFFVPNSSEAINGTLYELVPGTGFEKNSFVLLPYINPQKAPLSAQYYKIKSKQGVSTKELGNTKNIKISLKSRTSRDQYLEKVLQLKEQIQRGNIYEINYCIQFFSENVQLNPLDVFIRLHRSAKAPYACLLKLNEDYIICESPELFLKKEGNTIFTKPIKGTTRRGKDTIEDEFLKEQLHNSIKERTENVMAVDVARNDLSQFASKGSVKVNKLYNIETFETVHQMVSTVSCEIKANTSFEKIIESTFPMASMTGAPKLRAMTLIDQFEDFKRGAYSGSMGIIDENEDYCLNVIIRSIFYNKKSGDLSIAVGGAITYLSEAEKEYEECLLKANALLRVLNAEIE